MIAAIEFLGNTDVIAFRPFDGPDFAEFDAAPSHGVQAKEFVRDTDGVAWVIKSGALGREHPPDLSDEEERSRRAAFSVHEALMPLLYSTVGLLVNEVRLGFRTMHNIWGEPPTTQLVSLHRMQQAVRGEIAEAQGIVRDEGFVVSLLTMLCVDVVVAQRDHVEKHNYMLTREGRLVPNDNGACMKGDWIAEEPTFEAFEHLNSVEPNIGWTADRRAAVKARLSALTVAEIDAAFVALPHEAVTWHDERVEGSYYATGTIAEKQWRTKKNLEILRRWTESYQG